MMFKLFVSVLPFLSVKVDAWGSWRPYRGSPPPGCDESSLDPFDPAQDELNCCQCQWRGIGTSFSCPLNCDDPDLNLDPDWEEVVFLSYSTYELLEDANLCCSLDGAWIEVVYDCPVQNCAELTAGDTSCVGCLGPEEECGSDFEDTDFDCFLYPKEEYVNEDHCLCEEECEGCPDPDYAPGRIPVMWRATGEKMFDCEELTWTACPSDGGFLGYNACMIGYETYDECMCANWGCDDDWPPTPAPTDRTPSVPTPSDPTKEDETQDSGMLGDPHIKNWRGEWHDYHGECDLKLVHVPLFDGENDIDIHVRTRLRYDYSFIESAALKIGSDVFEVSSYAEHAFNGVEGALSVRGKLPIMEGKYPVVYTNSNPKKQSFTVILQHNQNVTMSSFKDWVSVQILHGNRETFGNASGLMGTFEGRMLARDGVTDLEQDINALGQDWQVRPDEPMLFRTIRSPQAPDEKCRLPDPNSDQTFRRLGEGGVSGSAAGLACASATGKAFQFCVRDVMVSGDLARAGSYTG